jgi:hypothetical protein
MFPFSEFTLHPLREILGLIKRTGTGIRDVGDSEKTEVFY